MTRLDLETLRTDLGHITPESAGRPQKLRAAQGRPQHQRDRRPREPVPPGRTLSRQLLNPAHQANRPSQKSALHSMKEASRRQAASRATLAPPSPPRKAPHQAPRATHSAKTPSGYSEHHPGRISPLSAFQATPGARRKGRVHPAVEPPARRHRLDTASAPKEPGTKIRDPQRSPRNSKKKGRPTRPFPTDDHAPHPSLLL